MMNAGPDGIRWQREVPAEIQLLGTLAAPDYSDIVIARTPSASTRSPEQWAVSFHGAAAGWARRIADAPDDVVGLIVGRGDGWVRLEEHERLLTTQYVCHAGDGGVSLAFFIRYERRAARLIWPLMSQIHRRVAVTTMRKIVSDAESGRPGP